MCITSPQVGLALETEENHNLMCGLCCHLQKQNIESLPMLPKTNSKNNVSWEKFKLATFFKPRVSEVQGSHLSKNQELPKFKLAILFKIES